MKRQATTSENAGTKKRRGGTEKPADAKRRRELGAKRAAASAAPSPEPEGEIALRADNIWQAEGCPAGCELRHWLQAEGEVRTQLPTGLAA